MSQTMLSIYIATYNHEDYIKQALDSVFMQETNYSYEVLVGEDCSTDNTREVLKQYEKNHPDLLQDGTLKILYRDHNMYRESPNNITDLVKRCSGKYIVALEGDDFWINKDKIQKQVDFLENNPDYIAVAHDCVVVDRASSPINEIYPTCRDEEYTLKHFMSNQFPGQTTTILYRNIYTMDEVNTDILFKGLMPGDKLRNYVLLMNGKIKCMPVKMSAYRHITDGGDSWSTKYSYKFDVEYTFSQGLMDYSIEENKKDYILASEALMFRCLAKALHFRAIRFSEFLRYFFVVNNKWFVMVKWIKYKVYKDLLHKKIWY